MYEEDTIAAIATPAGEGGVGIVRISGRDAERIVSAIFVGSRCHNGELKSHRLYHGKVRDPRTNKVVDEALMTIMRGPRSYTGEGVVELHCHGGPFLLRQVLGLTFAQGARHAEPGEFTKRAFLNGRIDLTQAEAVQDLIQARTEKQAELALDQFAGGVSAWIEELRELLLDILAQIEAAIDFPEEELELLRRDELAREIDNLTAKMTVITATYNHGRLFREGARVCICGRPNVGKSSLLNALVGDERVIVTPVAGTTRDVVEESININGLPAVLWDTAGIRETADEVEKLGVDLSLRHIAKADAIVVVVDGSVPLSEEDRLCLSSLENKSGLIVLNKADLAQACEIAEVRKSGGAKPAMLVSALRGDGLKDLERALSEILLGTERQPQIVLTNVRHKNALIRGQQALNSAATGLRENQPAECVAVDMNEAKVALEEIVGIINNDDILGRIFSTFCIGK